ncbi:MAG: glutaredoxin domain-containing protein [Atopobiaceae bacterium]|jgi:glutaredoxin-related protein|uniref:Glutaredoxin domain-containing protein n=1 Tax=Olsenella absiana TaxID=3115222 RepID=A0ABU7R8S7_9ACTN|nr:glutaredoxin domain-containing protein [Olsenella sp.]MDY3901471.1 glutaredoxin domain-containing protein [Atopobiaceae bacterium]
MIKVFVTMQCPDCRAAVRELDERNVDYALVGVEELRHLKEFMNLRDAHPDAFAPVLGKGIGVPCFVRDDGLVTLDLAEVLA